LSHLEVFGGGVASRTRPRAEVSRVVEFGLAAKGCGEPPDGSLLEEGSRE